MSERSSGSIPRVVFAGFASCFGCQINITNIEKHLLDVLGQIDMRYWQLTSSDPMPAQFDVAVIEGAITTKDAEISAKRLREIANTVITIGACAQSAGIPGMASDDIDTRMKDVYSDHVPALISDSAYSPRAVGDVIEVDFAVPCCRWIPMSSFACFSMSFTVPISIHILPRSAKLQAERERLFLWARRDVHGACH